MNNSRGTGNAATKKRRNPGRRTDGAGPVGLVRPAADPTAIEPATIVRTVPLSELRPSPENNVLYRPVDPKDASLRDLARSIRAKGVVQPLVVSIDGWIISGHRRFAAARMAGLSDVPCMTEPVRGGAGAAAHDPDAWASILALHNDSQRVKTEAEKLREAVVLTDPHRAYQSLVEHRRRRSDMSDSPLPTMAMEGAKRRKTISPAKCEMLAAVQRVVAELKEFWPVSIRQIHYNLLSDPPLRNADDPDSTYANDKPSYKDLCDLATRARLTGEIAWNVIADETRPMTSWDVYQETGAYLRQRVDLFLKDYWRDLQQGQPNHIEVVAEKLTVQSVVRSVAARYCVPYTIGRGYCSIQPRREMAQRFRRSGRDKLVLLILSDFDPDGEEIAASFARSMRDDFGINGIHPIKVALTADQVRQYQLPPVMQAKVDSVHHDKFVEKHGKNVWELEALPPATLQQILTDAVDSVLDVDAFNAEVDHEADDARFLEGVRQRLREMLSGVDLDDG